MIRLRSRKQKDTPVAGGLTVKAVDQTPLLMFAPEVVTVFRRMVTGLQAERPLPARLAMTSAIREEGVTSSAMALATTIAHDLGRSVCVVELNWQAPGLYRHLALPPAPVKKKRAKVEEPVPQPRFPATPGLAAVVAGQASLDEALIRTADPNLAFLPAGELRLERRPVVARSADLQATIDQIGQQFEHLILDVPAVLSSSDSIALAALGESCCLVVRQGVTSSLMVRQALDDIKHLPMIGVVMNQVQLHTPGWVRGLIPQE